MKRSLWVASALGCVWLMVVVQHRLMNTYRWDVVGDSDLSEAYAFVYRNLHAFSFVFYGVVGALVLTLLRRDRDIIKVACAQCAVAAFLASVSLLVLTLNVVDNRPTADLAYLLMIAVVYLTLSFVYWRRGSTRIIHALVVVCLGLLFMSPHTYYPASERVVGFADPMRVIFELVFAWIPFRMVLRRGDSDAAAIGEEAAAP